MPKIKAKINMSKLKSDLQREMKTETRLAMQKVSPSDRTKIGQALIDIMKEQIAKGMSPIQGWGRFPKYKWVGKALAHLKYPASVRHKFPGKRDTPVNLSLSGKFLKALKPRATTTGVEVGFFDSKYSKYEQGHREGANDQPERPIIPINEEAFTRNVYQRLVDAAAEIIARRFK